MRIYPLYEYLLTFEFKISRIEYNEYLMVKDDVFDNLSVADFKNANFYYDEKFITNKLQSLKSQLSYFKEILVCGMERFGEKDESRTLFRYFNDKLQEKGALLIIDEVKGSVRVVSFFIEDLIDLIRHRIEIVDSLLSGFDYSYSEDPIYYPFVPNERYMKFYRERDYPTVDDWVRCKIHNVRFPEFSEESRTLFNHSDAFDEFWRLIDQYKILEMDKNKVCVFMRKLQLECYFKDEITMNELAQFTTGTTKFLNIKRTPYTAKYMTAGKITEENWKDFLEKIDSEFKLRTFK